LNCAALTELIDDGQSIIDIGSGAGLPGIPMAIARPDAQFVLIEPMERRSSWMLAVVEDLGLKNVRVLRSRAEDVSEQDFDIVTARAVAALDKLLKMCVPLLKPGGALIALKGSKAAEEITNSKKLEKKLGISSFEILVCGEKFLPEPTSVVKTTLDS
jgi:16S rRNA (guanine527-N7)-methyltransferase